jgi:hypothetical protein
MAGGGLTASRTDSGGLWCSGVWGRSPQLRSKLSYSGAKAVNPGGLGAAPPTATRSVPHYAFIFGAFTVGLRRARMSSFRSSNTPNS